MSRISQQQRRRRHQDSSLHSISSHSSSSAHVSRPTTSDGRNSHGRRSIPHKPANSSSAVVISAIAILSSCIHVTYAFQRPSHLLSGINTFSANHVYTYGPNQQQHPHRRHQQHPRARPSPTVLNAVSKRQVSVLDGAELYSVESFLAAEKGIKEKPPRSGLARLGFLTVVAGTVEDDGEVEDNAKYSGKRVVGVEVAGGASGGDSSDEDNKPLAISLGGGVNLHKDSVAIIPDTISDADGMATMMASLSAVHCALPISENVGGSADASIISGKAVVVGGGEYATFAADALATLGADVFQISTGKPNPKNRNGELRAIQ